MHLRNRQLVVGVPMYPSGHVQMGLCPTTLQLALGAHGRPAAHGLMHWRFRHAV